MPVEVILFDLDDTLVVERASAEAAFLVTCEYANSKYGCDPKALTDAVRENARKLWYEVPTIDYCLKIGISSWEGLWARFLGDDPNLSYLRNWAAEYRQQSWLNGLSEFGVIDTDFAQQLSDTFMTERRTRHYLFPDSMDSLGELRGKYKLGLITNGAPDLQREKIERTDIEKFFDPIIVSGEIGIGKPDIRFFEPIFERFPVNNLNSMVLVGDSLDTDIKGAKNLGIRGIWINRGGATANDHKIVPDIQIKSLNELGRILS